MRKIQSGKLLLYQASLKDLDLLIKIRMEVLGDVFSIPPGWDTSHLAEENRRYYQWALSADMHLACLAYDGDALAGCGGICFSREMPSPDNLSGWCGYLMNIYTRTGYRGQGVAKLVVRWLIGEAQNRGVTKIFLEASPAGRPMYEKLGFTPMADEMQLDWNAYEQREENNP